MGCNPDLQPHRDFIYISGVGVIVVDQRKIVVLLGHKDHPPEDTQFLITGIRYYPRKAVMACLHRVMGGQVDSTCKVYARLDLLMTLHEFEKWKGAL